MFYILNIITNTIIIANTQTLQLQLNKTQTSPNKPHICKLRYQFMNKQTFKGKNWHIKVFISTRTHVQIFQKNLSKRIVGNFGYWLSTKIICAISIIALNISYK